MPIETHAATAKTPSRPALRLNYQYLVNAVFALFIFCGAIAFIEPSPYDFVSLVAIPMWFVGGFRVHRGVIPFIVLIILYNVAGFISLVPYWNEPDPRTFMLQSLYLAITAIFFVIFFSERTEERIALCLKSFAASTVFGALTGIIGYFDIAGTGEIFATYGRSAGTFKDPNVFGSYLILGALYLLQAVMLSRGKIARSRVHLVPRRHIRNLLFILARLGGSFPDRRHDHGRAYLHHDATEIDATPHRHRHTLRDRGGRFDPRSHIVCRLDT